MTTLALASPDTLGIELWLVDLDAPAMAPVHAGFDSVLSADEEARAARFHFERDARRYRASHTALRQVLAQATGCGAKELAFDEGPFGKPRWPGRQGVHFNMSHSGGWALIGVCADAPIGVDIEVTRDLDDLASLAQRNFSASEFEALQQLAPTQQLPAFLRCWTRKEACLKALGSGLSIEPHVFEAGIEPALRSTAIAVGAGLCRMSVVSLALPVPGLAACARLADADRHLAM